MPSIELLGVLFRAAPEHEKVEAVFEDRVFKPLERPEISEGEHVQLTVETTTRPEREDPLELAKRVYRDLRPEEIDEIERIAFGAG